MSPVEQRFYKSVSALSSVNSDYVVPNGQTLDIKEMAANAMGDLADTIVQIIWDPTGTNQILLSTTADSGIQHIAQEFVGDGVKIMRIMLTNNDIQARTIGGYFLGQVS